MLDNLLANLQSPNPAFRGAPFWAWNSKLDPAELRRQIRIFKEMGLGGFFMHSRVGMNTPYLSDQWFECIDACIDEAKKNGMDAWLYDEDRWPSGAAGGLVTANPDYRQKHLASAHAATAAGLGAFPEENVLGRYLVTWEKPGTVIAAASKVDTLPEQAPAGQELLVIWWQTSEQTSWFNGQTYLDTMNPEAVHKFIECTHEEYLKRCGEEFGKSVPGIFTDEPNFRHSLAPEFAAWTAALPAEFRKRFEYDVLDFLPELLFNISGKPFSKARHDYHEVCTSLFVNAFSKQIGQWCGEHNLQLVGHVLCEDRLVEQRHVSGAAMRFYEHMQTPGIDLLTEHWDVTGTAKQCSSVAHQLGKHRRMCECYGCTGWDFPFAGHKALGDWLAVLGINFRVQHLAWYTMEAEAKRDYPASISFQSSWYRKYSCVEDYFARVNAALWDGEEVRDILVVHPIESAWGLNPYLNDEELKELDGKHTVVANALLAGHLDFDYGDEELMSRYASVEKAADGKPRLRVGKALYRAVVLPEMTTIRGTTLELLRQFLEEGGQVVCFCKHPGFVDGVESDMPGQLFAACPRTFKAAELCGLLKEDVRRLSVLADGRQAAPIYALLKNGGDCETLFLTNTAVMHGMEYEYPAIGYNDPYVDIYQCQYISTPAAKRKLEFPAVKVTLRSDVPGADRVYELNLDNGELSRVKAEWHESSVSFNTSFAPLASRMFIITASELPVIDKETAPQCTTQVQVPQRWNYTLDEPNVLVLDQAEFTIEGKALDEEVHFITSIDDILRERYLGVRHRGGAMVQPWKTPADPVPEKVLDVELKFNFVCEEVPSGKVELAIEHPELYTIKLNKSEISIIDCGEWIDPAIRRIALPEKAFVPGLNYLTLRCRYHQYLPGLEAVYLLGNFGVRDQRVLTTLPCTLAAGDWTMQGLPFYSGCVTYSATVTLPEDATALRLTLGKWQGAAVGVRINGGAERLLGWPPYEAIFTEGIHAGSNLIEISVYSSRRNSFGPFYHLYCSPEWVGSGQLKAFYVAHKQLVPCGVLEPVEISIETPRA